MTIALLITLFHPGGAGPPPTGAFADNLPFFATPGKLKAWVGGTGAGPPTPANGYVAEDSNTYYVDEDGTTFYVQES